jgi:ABC-2 type transport system ATP-binding protein
MDDEIVISVKSVSKDFLLPHEKVDSVKDLFAHPFKKRTKGEVQHALHDISFDIKKGEFFGIVGRNGSGKSTLLKIIAQIYQPTSGSVTVNGRLVPFIELGVGFNPELTGRENVFLNGALMGFSRKEITAKYNAIVDFAEIERFMDQKLKNYSSGMQVRLAFSVATVLAESDILLIDEVLAVGDADFQRKCFEYFKNLKRNKKTVIFVSHDMGAIREYCDRAVLIDESKIIHEGTSSKIAKEYARLFTPKEENETKKGKKRAAKWGYGGVDMQTVHLSQKSYTTDDKYVEISVKATPLRDFPEGLVYGFAVKDLAGNAVVGTNSRIMQLPASGPIKKDQEFTINWKMLNIFSKGKYVFEPAINDGYNMDLCQWWDEAAKFEIINKTSTPYPVSPEIQLEIAHK